MQQSGMAAPNSGLREFGIFSGRSRIYPASAGGGAAAMRE
jgi:hypothetical protein